MDVERCHLLGDSSLQVNAHNVKKPLKGDLEEMLGGPPDVTHRSRQWNTEILEAGCSFLCCSPSLKRMRSCQCLGISYLGNDVLSGREQSFVCSRGLRRDGSHPVGCTMLHPHCMRGDLPEGLLLKV